MSLTPRQHEALAWIRAYISDYGIAPTQGEIARGLGVTQGTAAKLVTRLEERRVIATIPGKWRSITIIA